MTFSEDVLKNDEKAIMSLRSLYRQYGYTPYKMNKFEEYDLYVRNKNFLQSDNIITFTDISGKLMALKPDVTLSIVKNMKDSTSLQKYCYNENVFRVSRADHEFREIMQVGLECIGDIDVYLMGEVIMLAERSLGTISESHCLDISHMGFLSALLDHMAVTPEQRSPILRCISGKNTPELEKLCGEFGIDGGFKDKLLRLTSLYGPFEDALGTLRGISTDDRTDEALSELEGVYETVKLLGTDGRNIHIDFSIVNDMNYYSGIIFQGFVDGIPVGILSGGRYDNLMHRFKKESGAIGFAVYLDLLERLSTPKRRYDVDALLLYDGNTDMKALAIAVRELSRGGNSVRAQREDAGAVRYRQLFKMRDGRPEVVK